MVAIDFRIGDIVQLKSGGPLMTIDYIVGSGPDDELLREDGFKPGDVICQWFINDNISGRCFRPEVLLKVEIFSS